MAPRWLSLALIALPLINPASTVFDGRWWASQTKDQRDQFAAGFLDCSVAFPKAALNGNQYDVSKYISNFYKQRPGQSGKPVAQVLLEGGPGKQPVAAPGGEVYPGKHGYFDGDYWSQMDPDVRSSFVQGELVCQQAHHLAVDPEHAVRYTIFINQWFDADNGNSRLARQRGGYPIVHALEIGIRQAASGKTHP